MRGPLPPKPTGYDPEALFHQQTWEKLHGAPMKPRDSATVKWSLTTRGLFARVRPQRQSQQSGIGLLCKVVQTYSRGYISAHRWDGTTEGSTIYIAMNPVNWGPTPPATTIAREVDGDVITYSLWDVSVGRRTATSELFGTFWQEVISPSYAEDDYVWAMPVDHTGLIVPVGIDGANVELKYISIGDVRQYAAVLPL